MYRYGSEARAHNLSLLDPLSPVASRYDVFDICMGTFCVSHFFMRSWILFAVTWMLSIGFFFI